MAGVDRKGVNLKIIFPEIVFIKFSIISYREVIISEGEEILYTGNFIYRGGWGGFESTHLQRQFPQYKDLVYSLISNRVCIITGVNTKL